MKKDMWAKAFAFGVLLLGYGLICGVGIPSAYAQSQEGAPQVTVAEQNAPSPARFDLAIGISVAIAGGCIGAGYAVGRVGAAALGAASEKPELLTRSLIFVGLAEGIAIYGLLVAILLWIKL